MQALRKSGIKPSRPDARPGGVAVAQTDQPEVLHGSHVGHGWTFALHEFGR